MITQIARYDSLEKNTYRLDSLSQLGRLCGIDGLMADCYGLCCLALGDNRVVHMMCAPDGATILLSTELRTATSARVFSVYQTQRVSLKLQDEGSCLHLGDRDTLCLQRTFDATQATPDGKSNGVALLAAIDLLFSHADVWWNGLLELPLKSPAFEHCHFPLLKLARRSTSLASAH